MATRRPPGGRVVVLLLLLLRRGATFFLFEIKLTRLDLEIKSGFAFTFHCFFYREISWFDLCSREWKKITFFLNNPGGVLFVQETRLTTLAWIKKIFGMLSTDLTMFIEQNTRVKYIFILLLGLGSFNVNQPLKSYKNCYKNFFILTLQP